MRLWLALILALGTGAALAETVQTSPRPMPRPGMQTAPIPLPEVQTAPMLRPLHRPEGLIAVQPEPTVVAASIPMLRPKPRPAGLAQSQEQEDLAVAAPQKKPGKEKKSKKGSVCGDPAIKGVALARITSKVKGCGIENPVQVASVDGIRLSQPATIDCDTAVALKKWVQKSMRPAFGNREVVELRIAAHYICRPRNNVKGNKVSEHGRGKAIDISGFIFSDGKSWSIAGDYNKQIRKAHKGACGIFGTTLGPGSDGYHEDHLHFDTASYRSGSYCR